MIFGQSQSPSGLPCRPLGSSMVLTSSSATSYAFSPLSFFSQNSCGKKHKQTNRCSPVSSGLLTLQLANVFLWLQWCVGARQCVRPINQLRWQGVPLLGGGLTAAAYLSGLVNSLLRVCFDFVARVIGNLGNRLLKDGRRLSDWERRVQVRLALQNREQT